MHLKWAQTFKQRLSCGKFKNNEKK